MRRFSRSKPPAALAGFVAAATAITGCWSSNQQTLRVIRPGQFALPHPTKDEVALVDGRAFSISGFYALKARVKHASNEAVVWVGIAALAIQNETRSRDRELELDSAVQIARYALGDLSEAEAGESLREFFGPTRTLPSPSTTRQEIEQLLSRAVVQRNNQVLSALNQS